MSLAIARRLAPALALLACAAPIAAGCGGGSGDATEQEEAPAVPGDAAHEEVAVIQSWVETLREGDVEAAADHFAIPSIAENGGLVLRIRSREDAVAFNESLPCGAELVRAEGGPGDFITATFELTERPGPGTCGAGTGELARTAFLIEDGRIVEWRRVDAPEPEADGQPV